MGSDAAESRREAIGILRDLLAGRAGAEDVKRRWPPAGPDALLKRAFFEAQHFFVVRGAPLQRRVLEMLVRFLEEGGTPEAFSAEYDRAVKETGGCFCPD